MRGEPTRKPAVRKPVVFIGRALDEIRDFPSAARQDAGHQIDLVQCGETPRGSKPMPSVGKGVREIRIAEDDGWFRVFYAAMKEHQEQQEFASVFDALADTPAESENLKVRSQLMRAIRDRIDEFGWSQRVAATNLGVTQPRISDLKNGKMSRFSVDTLVNLAAKVGLTVEVRIVDTRTVDAPA
ncbi:XRE family transcriptional regulator [Nocardia farcinica]|nr:XRE family transcriptional regulator [Nocardia farcinica]